MSNVESNGDEGWQWEEMTPDQKTDFLLGRSQAQMYQIAALCDVVKSLGGDIDHALEVGFVRGLQERGFSQEEIEAQVRSLRGAG